MKKNLKRYIDFHASLMNCIEKKNCKILELLEKQNLNAALSLIEEKKSMVRIVNKSQKDIEKIITEINGYYLKNMASWYQNVSQWIFCCRQYDKKIMERLNLAKISLKKEIYEIHTKRIKFQGYNLKHLAFY